MAIEEPLRYVILMHGPDGWEVDAEESDYTTAVVSVRWYHDQGKTARLVDTQEEF